MPKKMEMDQEFIIHNPPRFQHRYSPNSRVSKMKYSLDDYIGREKTSFLDANYFAILEVVVAELQRHGLCRDNRQRVTAHSLESFDGGAFLEGCYISLPDFISRRITIRDFIYHIILNQKKYALIFDSVVFDIMEHEMDAIVQGITKH